MELTVWSVCNACTFGLERIESYRPAAAEQIECGHDVHPRG
jgi:hypothetical protein